MRDNDIQYASADAEFDARCKALLEGRAVTPPAPRETLFATAATATSNGKVNMRWASAIALALIAGAALWTFQDTAVPSEATPVNAAPQPSDAAEAEGATSNPEPAVMAPISDSEEAEQESEEVNANQEDLSSVATAVTTPVDPAPQPAKGISEPRQEVLISEAGAEAGQDIPVSEGPEGEPAEQAPVVVASPENTGEAPEKEAPESASSGAPAVPASAPEEAPEATQPRLKLPLTLPSGGGQR